jgi:hypothetical protein
MYLGRSISTVELSSTKLSCIVMLAFVMLKADTLCAIDAVLISNPNNIAWTL